jgi:hypothetical protein
MSANTASADLAKGHSTWQDMQIGVNGEQRHQRPAAAKRQVFAMYVY